MTQTSTPEDRARIRLVADAMRERTAESEIINALVGSGVPQGLQASSIAWSLTDSEPEFPLV